MLSSMKGQAAQLLRWSERYTGVDMLYLASIGWWMNLGTVLTSLLSLVLYIVFGRLLPKDVYGTYQYLLSVGTIIGAFTLTGMNSAVARAVARGFDGELKRAIVYQLKWGLLPLAIAGAAGGYYLLHGNSVIGYGLFLLGVFIPFNNAFNTYGVFITAKGDFRRGFVYSMLWNTLYIGSLIAISFFSPSALALLTVNLVSQAIGLALIYWHLIRTYAPNDHVNAETIPYGLHLTVMGFIATAVGQADSIMAFHFLGAAVLAIYSFATAIPDRIAGLLKFLTSATLIKFSTKTHSDLTTFFGRRIVMVVAAIVALIVLYIIAAPVIFQILFRQYDASIPYSRLYSLVMFSVIGDILIAALTAVRNVRGLYILRSGTALMQLLILFAGVWYGGLWGLVIGKIAGTFAAAGVALLFIHSLSRPPKQ